MIRIGILASLLMLVACSPAKNEISHHYKMSGYSTKRYHTKPGKSTLLVTQTQAAAGYQSDDMLYIKKPFSLESFSKNGWVDPPANMFFPLLVQSLEQSNRFRAVASTPFAEPTNYRLDTQLIELHQNFLQRPSVIQLSVKATLSNAESAQIIASHIFRQQVPCPSDNPYGGVIATNTASQKITHDITRFVLNTARG